jgi:hypothetical protein
LKDTCQFSVDGFQLRIHEPFRVLRVFRGGMAVVGCQVPVPSEKSVRICGQTTETFVALCPWVRTEGRVAEHLDSRQRGNDNTQIGVYPRSSAVSRILQNFFFFFSSPPIG